jgi:GLPGLI family protein
VYTMRINHLVFILGILIFKTSFSQEKGVLKVEYNELVSYIPQIVNHDKGFLLVTQNFSYYRTVFDNTTALNEIDNNTIVVPALEDEYFSEILIKRNQDSLIENLFERRAMDKYFSVSEIMPKMNWKLVSGTKKIGELVCKKAELNFRGRFYTAFYTEEIPISLGPWKFHGLPGLIVQVEDEKGVFKWNLASVSYPLEQNINLEPVFDRVKNFENITYKKFDSKLIESLKYKFKAIKSRAGNRNLSISTDFDTSEWKEPTNEWRKETKFSF